MEHSKKLKSVILPMNFPVSDMISMAEIMGPRLENLSFSANFYVSDNDIE
jgi:hypothetical protein